MSDDKIKLIRDSYKVFQDDLKFKVESEHDKTTKDIYSYLLSITTIAFVNYEAIEEMFMRIEDIQITINKMDSDSKL